MLAEKEVTEEHKGFMSEGDRVDRSLDTEHDLGLPSVKDFFVR